MNRAAVPLFAWATLLTVLTTVLWFWSHDHLPPAIFSGAAGVAWLLGFYALLHRGIRPHLRAAPDLSLPSALVAMAITMLLLGALVGEWLVLIGAGALVIGLIGVARELRAERSVR